MKKIVYICSIIFCVFFVACKDTDVIIEEQTHEISKELFAQTEYNLDLRDFALAVSNAMNESEDFKMLIKKEALKKFDDDYDVLLSHIIDQSVTVDNSSGSLRSNVSYTVKELLDEHYQASNPSVLRATSTSTIASLSTKYPDLQISVPIYPERLNPDTIPLVTFIPKEMVDGVEQTIVAFKPDGSIVNLSNTIQPNEPVIVISMNERMGALQNDVVPLTPAGLTGVVNENGIALSWAMPAGTNQYNTTGYEIYRKKGTERNPSLLAEVSGCNNRSYTDVDVTNNVTYSYYVIAYNANYISEPSNYITVAPARPAAASAFSVVQESASLVKLAWTFAANEYNGNVSIYKRLIGGSSNYGTPIATLAMPVDEYFDRQVQPGQKVEYKLERATAVGASTPKYDFIFAPYRNPAVESIVRIRAIRCNDVDACESWLRGAPEFKIKLLNVDSQGKTSEFGQIDIQLASRESNAWTLVNYNVGFVKNWKPGGSNWYDCISFYVVEDDSDGGFVNNFSLNAQMNLKNFELFPTTLDKALTATSALSLPINFLKSGDDVMGYMYLNYYDNYDIMLHASGSGGFDMKLCDHGNNVHEIPHWTKGSWFEAIKNYYKYHPNV